MYAYLASSLSAWTTSGMGVLIVSTDIGSSMNVSWVFCTSTDFKWRHREGVAEPLSLLENDVVAAQNTGFIRFLR